MIPELVLKFWSHSEVNVLKSMVNKMLTPESAWSQESRFENDFKVMAQSFSSLQSQILGVGVSFLASLNFTCLCIFTYQTTYFNWHRVAGTRSDCRVGVKTIPKWLQLWLDSRIEPELVDEFSWHLKRGIKFGPMKLWLQSEMESVVIKFTVKLRHRS